MRKLNISLLVLVTVLFIQYFIFVYSSKRVRLLKLSKNVTIGHKLSDGFYNNSSMAKMFILEEGYKKVKEGTLTDTSEYIHKLKDIINQVDVTMLNSFYKKRFFSLKREIEKQEYLQRYIIKLNAAIRANMFGKAYKIAKILYKLTNSNDYLYQIRNRKIFLYRKIGENCFLSKNYVGAKQFYILAYNLAPSDNIQQKIQTINNILKLGNVLNIQKQVTKTNKVTEKIKKYEENYKLLHLYYLLKEKMISTPQVKGINAPNLMNAINIVAKKWKEVRKISKELLKAAFELMKNDNRTSLELALKKIKLAEKYFPYFYKYSQLINDLKAKIEYSGMMLVPSAIVTYSDPLTKKIITKKVESFYIDKNNLTFGEYLEYLIKNHPEKFERLKKILLQHKYKGDISKKEVELVNYMDIKKFAKYMGKKIPTLTQLVSFCNYYSGAFDKKYSLFSSESVNNKVVVFGGNYLMHQSDRCMFFFKVSKNISVPGISVRLVKNK